MSQDDSLIMVLNADTHPVEWERAWGVLAQLNDGDPVCECKVTGQVWQYICTSHSEDGWMHYFRHRHHPITHCRESVLIPCSDECLAQEKSHAATETTQSIRAEEDNSVDLGRG